MNYGAGCLPAFGTLALAGVEGGYQVGTSP